MSYCHFITPNDLRYAGTYKYLIQIEDNFLGYRYNSITVDEI